MMTNKKTPEDKKAPVEVEFYYVVAVDKDGTIQTFREIPAEGIESQRPFNTLDIYKVSQEIVSDIKDQLLSDRVITGLMNVLQAQQQPVSARVAEALKERGVEFNAGESVMEFSADNVQDAEVVKD
jgi:hypothetical protein